MFPQLLSHMASAAIALFVYWTLQQVHVRSSTAKTSTISENCDAESAQVPELIQASGRCDDDDADTDDDEDTCDEDDEENYVDDDETVSTTSTEINADPLSRLVEEDSEEVQAIKLTPAQLHLITQLIQIRRNLESFLEEELLKLGEHRYSRNKSLCRDINQLRYLSGGAISDEFCDAMHTLRFHGNAAVHARFNDLPSYEDCVRDIRNYMELKQQHKQKVAKGQ